jgi:hypothetical protein
MRRGQKNKKNNNKKQKQRPNTKPTTEIFALIL